MRKQVSFDKWTISHVDAAPSGLEWSFPAQISYCHLRAFIASTLLLGYNIPCNAIPSNLVILRPIWKLGRLYYHTSEKLRERVEEVSLGFSLLDPVSVLGEGCLEAMIDCLRDMVIESIEENLLSLLWDWWIFDKRIGNIVCSHPV